MFGLKQIIKSPTRITCKNTSLIDHNLASIPSRVSQHGVINVSVSGHQLIYCTRKINKIKTGSAHKHITFISFKKYTVDTYKDALKKVNFPNYELFNDVNEVYSNFFQKIRIVADSFAPFKTKRVKANTQKRFDREVLENINTRNKVFKKFKKSRLHINKELYKKAKYNTLKLITAKIRAFFDDKLSENIGKPIELWETLKSLAMPQKTLILNFNAVESNNAVTFDKLAVAKIFKVIFSNLAESLLIKLPNAPNKYNIESVFQYYSKFIIEKPFHMSITYYLYFDLSGKFSKDGAEILIKPPSKICNLSITSRAFPNACKVAKLKPIFKKGKKTDPSNYIPISLLPFMAKQMHSSREIIYYIITDLDS